MELYRYTDQEIVQAILRRDTFITKDYLYRKCYPLFKAIYDKYYTDCENPIELINEIYVYILIYSFLRLLSMTKFFKYVIVWAFYIVAFILCIGGTTAIAGVPLGLIGVMLQRKFNISID